MKTLSESLKYTPVQPGFGTSGVRALVDDLTDLEVYCLTLGTLRYFEKKQLITNQHNLSKDLIQIPLACDLRPSSPRITCASIKAIQDCGYSAEYLGQIPTPALTCYAMHKQLASFMITGSHIPLDRNGQKANRFDGEVMKSDEQGIVAEVNTTRETILSGFAKESVFDAYGMLKPDHNQPLPPPSSAAEEYYRQRYADVFPEDSLSGLRIVFFEYSAVGRDCLPMILRNAGAEVICMGRSDEFFPIDTEAISDQHLHDLAKIVQQARDQYGKIDALVSTDGDSDRPLVLGVTESTEAATAETSASLVHVRFIPGDILGLMVSDYLGVDSISVPISSSPAIQEFFLDNKIPVSLTRIGSPHVIASMQKSRNSGYQRIAAWEANGGFLTGSELSVNAGQLSALPTRDAMLPIICVLHACVQNKQSLAEMVDDLPAWYGKAGLLDDFPRQASSTILEALTPSDPEVTTIQFDSDQVILCDNNNKIIVQYPVNCSQAAQLLRSKQLLESVFCRQHGFGELLKINYLDGIRCYFDNDDIAHIRPSGNAPQLRIYACARTRKRVDEIVALGIEEPAGLLTQLAERTKQHTQ